MLDVIVAGWKSSAPRRGPTRIFFLPPQNKKKTQTNFIMKFGVKIQVNFGGKSAFSHISPVI